MQGSYLIPFLLLIVASMGWDYTGTECSVLSSSALLEPRVFTACLLEDSCGYLTLYISSGTPFFSVVMLLLDAAKISEKASWDLLLLEAVFTSG